MAARPQSPLRRTLACFRPAVLPSLLVALAVALIVAEVGATSVLGLIFALVDPDGWKLGLGLHDLGYGLLVAPIAGALLVVAASLPSSMGFRALLLGGLTLVLAFGLTSCASMPLAGTGAEKDPYTLPIVGIVLYGPATLAAVALTVGALATVPLQVRQLGVDQVEDWLAAQLEETGWLEVPGAAATLGREEAWLWDMAVALAVDRRIPVRDQGVYLVHRDTAAQGFAAVLDHVRDTGRTTLEATVAATGLPQALVRGWVDELAADGKVPLTVDRQHGELVWDVAKGVTEMSWCPRCGGPERPAGGGVLRCGSCGSERAT